MTSSTSSLTYKEPQSPSSESFSPKSEPLLSGNQSSDLEDQKVDLDTIDKLFKENFKQDEIEALEKAHNCNYEKLKQKIAENWGAYYLFKTSAVAALLPEFPFVIYQILRGSAGVQEMGKVINDKIDISDKTAFWINVPLSGIDFIYNVHTFGPTSAALKQTLSFGFYSPTQDINDYIAAMKADPGKTLCKTAITIPEKILDQFLLLTHNVTGAVANLIDIYSWVPSAIGIPILALGTPLGVLNYSLFCNEDYYAGKEFLRDKKKPYLVNEMVKGNISLPLEVFAQGVVGGAAIRGLTFAGIAELISTILGGWIPSAAVGIAVFLHTLATRYPSTYNRYLDDHLTIRELISRIYEDKIIALISENIQGLNLNLTPTQSFKLLQGIKRKIIDDLAESIKKMVTTHLENTHGKSYLWNKSGTNLIGPLSQGVVGGGYLFGYGVLTPFINSFSPESLVLQIVSYGIGPLAGTLAGTYFPSLRAEMIRVQNKEVRTFLEKKRDENQQKNKSSGITGLDVVSFGVTTASYTQRMFTTLALLELQPFLKFQGAKALNSVLALKQAVNSIFWVQPKVAAAFRARWNCFFEQKPNQDIPENNKKSSSWCCLGRKR